MSRVAGITPGGVPNRPKPAATGRASGFNVESEDAAPAIQENAPAQSVLLAGMLALQETETETAQDKTARRHGIALLEALSQIQKSLLSLTEASATEIETLTLLVNAMPQASNPGLAGTLADIRLRAKIELLRLGIGFS